MKKKIFCFDIDNTIFSTKKNFYSKSKPIKKNIKIVNHLYDHGHTIIIFTARRMTTFNGNVDLITKNFENLTRKQLKKFNVKYHKLIFGKPSFDYLIDDKSIFYKKNWSKNFIKKYS